MLEYMKSLDMPINEHVYAALVTGHSRGGDMAAAEKLLTVMRENGLAPGIITYTSLLCAHAEKGDMDAIHRVSSCVCVSVCLSDLFCHYDIILNSISVCTMSVCLSVCTIHSSPLSLV